LQAENDANAALDALTNPLQRGALQLAVVTKQVGYRWWHCMDMAAVCLVRGDTISCIIQNLACRRVWLCVASEGYTSRLDVVILHNF